jgi:3-hydroxyacyl-CoA dehydrogenase
MRIEKVTVIGSGVMGSGIAAQLVNGGFGEVRLLDIIPSELTDDQIAGGYTLDDRNIRNLVSRANLNKLIKSKPPQLGALKLAKEIILGNTSDDFENYVSGSDWIIEVVPEIAGLKNETFKRIDRCRKPDAIVSSNTSGISIDTMTEGCSEGFKEHFLITHFFNPVRYMRLLEIIESKTVNPEVVETVISTGEELMGKEVVLSFDVPGFVANRIGVYNIMFLMSQIEEYGVEEVNTVFDKKLGYGGKPFSTCDLVGLDTLVHVVNYIYENTDDECRRIFEVPEFLKRLVDAGRLGRKSGEGFFKREKKDGRNMDYVIDIRTGEYIPRKNPVIKSVERARKAGSLQQAVSDLYKSSDIGGEIFRKAVNSVIKYSFARVNEISPEGIEGIDKAVRLGFNQKLGPGEMLDIIGVERFVRDIEREGDIPQVLRQLYRTDRKRVYFESEEKEDMVFESPSTGYRPVVKSEKYSSFREVSKHNKPVLDIKDGGRLFALEDDIFAFEMTSKNGTINLKVIEALNRSLEIAKNRGRGLIIGSDLDNFSFGADLNIFAGYIFRGKKKFVEEIINEFQILNYNLKYSKIPVVVMKRGMALGGGCELGFGANIRAAHDSYMGLVEFGVGLIPGGGGVKELLIRKYKKHSVKEKFKPFDYIQEAFMQIAFAKVAMSAYEAKELGYMSDTDGISMNKDFLLTDAKQDIMRLSADYKPPEEVRVLLPGQDIMATLFIGIDLAAAARQLPPQPVPDFIRRHMALVLKTLSGVVSGGGILPPGKEFSELELLELERKAFLRLTTGMSLKEKFAWLGIVSSTLKKKPIPWAVKSVRDSYFRGAV